MSRYALREGIKKANPYITGDGYGFPPALLFFLVAGGATTTAVVVGKQEEAEKEAEREAERKAAERVQQAADRAESEYPPGTRGPSYTDRKSQMKAMMGIRTNYEGKSLPILKMGDQDTDYPEFLSPMSALGMGFPATYSYPYFRLDGFEEDKEIGIVTALNYFLFGSQCDGTSNDPSTGIYSCTTPNIPGNPLWSDPAYANIIDDDEVETRWMWDFDDDTESALKLFQAAHGLPVTGQADREFWRWVMFYTPNNPASAAIARSVDPCGMYPLPSCQDIVMIGDEDRPPEPEPQPESQPEPEPQIDTDQLRNIYVDQEISEKDKLDPPDLWYKKPSVWVILGSILVGSIVIGKLAQGKRR